MAELNPIMAPRAFLRALFEAAVQAADPIHVIPKYLPPEPKGRVIVIGAGKASARMAEALEPHFPQCEGIVITRYGYGRPCKRITILEAAHPVPDAAGVAATQKLLELVSDVTQDDLVIALISGGGSALLCAPREGISLGDKQRMNDVLLASGAPISEMNVIRQQVSRVKGGQLAQACAPAHVISLMISDIPGDDPALIASGPTVEPSGSAGQALEYVSARGMELPPSVMTCLEARATAEEGAHVQVSNVENHVIAAPSQSLEAARFLANECEVRLLGDALEGEARALAGQHAALAMSLSRDLRVGDRPILLLSGGECTVTRRGDGVGGPNAEYVLAAALALDGQEGIHVLACDTDGVDGAAEVAGAYASGQTCDKARALGVDPNAALARNDAHGFFGQLEDQIITGPTLTNVNDFRALLILPPE